MAFEVFNLFAKLGLDTKEFDEGLDSSGKKASVFGDVLKANLVSKGIEVAVKGMVKLGKATVDMVSQSVNAYADYEQLVGGVETLFKTSADVVQEYAANAYKTAGLSANEYMETVTSFSASLLQSLGGDTQKAAEVSDMAIRDMSDNANKMGTAMESIQVAYQGFAKQNYTMLDNLKLGYGGTKSEMERLLADAEAFSGVHYDIENLNDVYEAIHVVQTELGITGTTAKEASETISGSVSSMKSAWANLVTGIADENADFDELVSNFVESASTVGDNLLPRINQALQGVGKLVQGLAPVIADAVPMLINDVLPSLLTAGASLVGTIGKAVIDNLPLLLDTGLQLILTLANGIVENLPTLIPTIIQVVLQIVDTLTQPDTLSGLIDAAIAIILALVSGLIDAVPTLLEKVPEIIKNLVDAIIKNAPKLLNAGVELVNTLVQGFFKNLSALLGVGKDIVDQIKSGFNEKVEAAKNWGKDLIDNFICGIKEKWESLKSTISNVAQTIKDFLGFSEPKMGPLSNFHTYAPDMMDLFIAGIDSKKQELADKLTTIADVVSGVFSDIRKSFDLRGDIGKLQYDLWELQYDAGNTALKSATEEIETQKNAISAIDEQIKAAKEAVNTARAENERTHTMDSLLEWHGAEDRVRALEEEKAAMEEALEALEQNRAALEDQAAIDKYAKQQESLSTQLENQAGVVEAALSAFEQITEQYGEGSDESLEYQKTLLSEQIAYEKLLATMNDVIEAREKLNGEYAVNTQSMDFASSGLGKVSAATMNGLQGVAQSVSARGGDLTVKCVLSDGKEVARAWLPDFISVGASNGTPIATPVAV